MVSSNARLAEFPDLPTFKDLGYDDLTAVSWFALSGPAGLPKDITQRLNATVATMLERPEVRKRLDRDSIETHVMSPEEFTQFVAGEIAKWTPVAKRVMQGTKAVPVRIDSTLNHFLASPAGLTRGSIFFARRFCEEEDGLHRNSGLPEFRMRAASRVNPTCGVKPGNDGGEAVAGILRPFEREPL